MSESETSPVVEVPKPVKKRSPWERAAVWGGILLMLAVVLLEWKSREGHDATVNGLEELLGHGKIIPLSELSNHVHGYAVRGEEQNGKERILTFRWPSLFKHYMLYIPTEQNDQISSFETAESRANPPPPVTPVSLEGRSLTEPNPASGTDMPTKDTPPKDAPTKDAPTQEGAGRKTARPD